MKVAYLILVTFILAIKQNFNEKMKHDLKKVLKLTLITISGLSVATLPFFKSFSIGLILGGIGLSIYIYILIKGSYYLFSADTKKIISFLFISFSLKMFVLLLPFLIAVLFFETATFFGVLGVILIFKFILILPI